MVLMVGCSVNRTAIRRGKIKKSVIVFTWGHKTRICKGSLVGLSVALRMAFFHVSSYVGVVCGRIFTTSALSCGLALPERAHLRETDFHCIQT